MKTKYKDNLKLLFTDTDSLCYEVTTDDIYKDMADQKHLYDFSESPTDHPLFSTVNKKLSGLLNVKQMELQSRVYRSSKQRNSKE